MCLTAQGDKQAGSDRGEGANEKKYSETRQLLARKSLSLVSSDRFCSPVQEIIICFEMDEA
jgi:hypothetical protein